jgi:hypothetical protein
MTMPPNMLQMRARRSREFENIMVRFGRREIEYLWVD